MIGNRFHSVMSNLHYLTIVPLIYSFYSDDPQKTQKNLNTYDKVKSVVYPVFLGGFAWVSLVNVPSVFALGIQAGLLWRDALGKHVFQRLGDVKEFVAASLPKVALAVATIVYLVWIQLPRKTSAFAAFTSLYVAHRISTEYKSNRKSTEIPSKYFILIVNIGEVAGKILMVGSALITAHTNTELFWSTFLVAFFNEEKCDKLIFERFRTGWEDPKHTSEKVVVIVATVYALYMKFNFFWPFAAIYSGLYCGSRISLMLPKRSNSTNSSKSET